MRIIERSGYAEALALQDDLVARRRRDEIPDTLVLLEHPDVYTLGRGATADAAPARADAEVHHVSRGGEGTWHGPGQTVGYWIRKLEGGERDLHRHLRLLEQALIDALAALGVAAGRRAGFTGVWTERGKIASIGVAVRSWVAFHGFGLNRSVDPAAYVGFRPCGLAPDLMTDLAAAGAASDRASVERALETSFRELQRRLHAGLPTPVAEHAP